MAQPREVPADDRFIQLPDAGDLRQTDEQDAAEGEQDGGHRQAGKAPAAEAAKELPQLLAGDKARPQKAAGKEKGQLGYAQLFHKTTPLFSSVTLYHIPLPLKRHGITQKHRAEGEAPLCAGWSYFPL